MDRFLKRSNQLSAPDELPPAKKRKSAASKQDNICANMHAADYAPKRFIAMTVESFVVWNLVFHCSSKKILRT